MKKEDKPIIVEQTFNTSIEKVWAAITEVEQMKKWFFDNIPSFKPEVGFETQFNVQSEERNFMHLWKIVEAQPLKLIKYNWKYEGYSGDSFVTFELYKQDDGTKLTLTTEVIEDFPDDIPEFRRENCIGGWEYFINESLKNYLDERNK